jgi:ABC-type nitrate/sulfonate/bicarbonate transport system substrate-binding protein
MRGSTVTAVAWSAGRRRGLLGIVSATVLACGLIAACSSSGSGSAAGSSTNTGSGSSAATLKPITFDIGYQDPSSIVLQLIADQQGYFAKEGITPTYTLITTGTGIVVSGVVSGSLDGGVVSLSTLIQTQQKGVSVQLLGGIIHTKYSLAVLSSNKTTPVASGTDFSATLRSLQGKTIGVAGVTGGPALSLNAFAKQIGMPADPFHYVDIEPGAPVVAAMKSGSVDAVYNGIQFVAPTVLNGSARQVMTSDNGPAGYTSSLLVGTMVDQKFLASNPGFAQRYQAAIAQATTYFDDQNNEPAIVALIKQKNFTFLINAKEYLDQVLQPQATVAASALDSGISFIYNAGIVPATPRVTANDVMVSEGLG